MTQEEWVEQLQKEGYRDINVVTFGPDQEIPEHTHDETTVHIVTAGEMLLIENGKTETRKAGERFEIPAGTTHIAKGGPTGCTFVVGVKN